MKIALLSDVSIEPLAAMLCERGHEVWTPTGFGAWRQTLLAPPADLSLFSPDAAFLLLDNRDAAPLAAGAGWRWRLFAVDIDDLADETGRDGFYDCRFGALASLPWSLAGMRALAGEIERLCAFAKAPPKKVLALDLDGTLWDGVVGEDGIERITPRDEAQKTAKALAARGVLLVALSANNAEDAEPAWRDPRMTLKREDFTSMRIDWRPKSGNLADIARELNLGTDSFVFVDDNPAQRARMRAEMPDVAVPETINLRRVARLYFPETLSTAEDSRRSAQYREEAARRESAAGATLENWLESLQIVNDIHAARPGEYARIAQLSQKCNQFNASMNRRSEAEIERLACDPSRILVAVRTRDRFGDMGLIAFVHAVVSGDEAEIEDWTMSCRAMNRRIEFAVEESVEGMLRERGVRRLAATWRKTAKNAPVGMFFGQAGFRRGETSPSGEVRWSKDLV